MLYQRFSGLYVFSSVPIILPMVNSQRKIIRKNSLSWLPYSHSSFNLASYNSSVSNIDSAPPLHQSMCSMPIDLFISHDPYEVYIIISPTALKGQLRLTEVMHFAHGLMSNEHLQEQPLAQVPASGRTASEDAQYS